MAQPPSDETRIQPDGRPPEQFGRYRIRQMLGQGAMGRVYLAEDVPLGRRVALKIPTLREGDSSELLDRFYREARSAGGLNHPNICPVYDVGEIDGVHYIAMANIEGRPLSDLLASNKPLAERQAMILVQKLAHALQEAHNHRIVHRDLKPSNIMLDAGDEPIITDFGLARRIYLEGDTRLTRSGMILGSPAYMSPEQAQGDHATIGPASDQYSLGVILYQLLTGHVPFRGSFAAMTQQILNDPPTPLRQLRPDVLPQLEAICLRMLAKSPSDRFPSLSAVANELSPLLSHSSQPGSAANRNAADPALQTTVTMTHATSAHARRPRWLVLTVGALAALVLASGIWLLKPSQPAAQSVAAIEAPQPPPGDKPKPATNASQAKAKQPRQKRATRTALIERPPKAPAPAAQLAHVGHGHAATYGRLLRVLDARPGHFGGFTCVAFSPDGAQIASGTVLGAVVVWNVTTGRVVAVLKGHDSYVRCVEFSPDGRLIASGGFDHAIEIWDTSTWRETHRLVDHASPVLSVAFQPDGTQLMSASSDRVLRFGNVATPHAVLAQAFNNKKTGRSPMALPVAMSADGTKVAIAADETSFSVRSPPHPRVIFKGHTNRIACLAFSKDGQRIASGSHDLSIKIWDAATGREELTLKGHENMVSTIAFSPDGTQLASGSYDKSLKIWNTATGRETATCQGHGNTVCSVAFSLDGKRLASGSWDQTVRLWDPSPGEN